MTKHYLLALTLLSMLFCIPCNSQAKDPIRIIEGIVINVSDGDTFSVQDSLGTRVKVRVYGIDAPETDKPNKPGQPYGEESWKALKGKVYGKQVKLDVMDIDKYKRLVCIVYLNGKSINQEMVSEGHAWAYRKYLDRPYASEYIEHEEQARVKRLGLWQQGNLQPPWEFRSSLKQRRFEK